MPKVIKEDEKPKSTWRKAHMIDLNTLDTPEKWHKKLEGMSKKATIAMFIAMKERHLMK